MAYNISPAPTVPKMVVTASPSPNGGPSTTPPVAILTQGPLAWASSRFRGAWLAEAAPGLFGWYPPDRELALADCRVIVFQKRHNREAFYLARAAKDRGIKIVIDLTDPLWWFSPQEMTAMLGLADAVTVSSDGLKKAVEQNKNVKRAICIPDRMLPSFHPTVAEHGPRDIATLTWFGLSANRVALVGALPVLAYAANVGHRFRLRIIDNQPTEKMEVQGPIEIENVAWALETIHAQIAACDIALLPPYPGPWGDMKSNNKAVTAWWCGLPVTDGFDPGEVMALITDAERRKRQGAANRRRAEKEYDIALSVRQWHDLLDDLGVVV